MYSKAKGFTLLEIAIVIAIISVLAAVGLIFGLQNYLSYATKNERDVLVSVLIKARSQAINNVCIGSSCSNGVSHGVKLTYNPTTYALEKYTIFQGTTYNANDPLNEDITPSHQLFFSTTPANTVSQVVFQQLSGTVSLGGSGVGVMTLSDTTGRSFTISLTSEGRIAW